MASAPGSPIAVAGDVVSRRVEDEVVLVKLGTNEIFSLNRTGGRIWELIVEGYDESTIAATLAAEFDVDPERAQVELGAYLDELKASGFIQD